MHPCILRFVAGMIVCWGDQRWRCSRLGQAQREMADWHRRSPVDPGTENWCCAKPGVFGNPILVVFSFLSDRCSTTMDTEIIPDRFDINRLNCISSRAPNGVNKSASLSTQAQNTHLSSLRETTNHQNPQVYPKPNMGLKCFIAMRSAITKRFL